MSIYANFGFVDFIIAAGYKGELISEWVESSKLEWNVVVYDTGLTTQTGGRLKRILNFNPGETFLATYGDGLGNVNIPKSIETHKNSGALATLTAVRPPARFGYLELDNASVTKFGEKVQTDAGWINGGFFILKPDIAAFINSDEEPFETGALPRLVAEQQLSAHRHYGFWQPVDTLRERDELESLCRNGEPPWLQL